MKSVVLVTHQFFPESAAGAEVLALELGKALCDRGSNVVIFTAMRSDREFLEEYSYDGVRVVRIHYKSPSLRHRVRYHLINPYVENSFSDFLRGERPDVVHFIHTMSVGLSLVGVAKEHADRVVMSVVDFWAVCPTVKLYRQHEDVICTDSTDSKECFRCMAPFSSSLLSKALYFSGYLTADMRALRARSASFRQAFSSLDAVFVPTRATFQIFRDSGFSVDLFRVIPFGVNNIRVAKYQPIVNRPLRIGFIGSIVYQKGLHILLSALKGISGSNIELLVYGNKGQDVSYARSLDSLLEAISLPVHFRGTFNNAEIAEVFDGIDLLVVPSVWLENMPLVLCSAIRAGVPVIVSDVGGMAELTAEAHAGFTFKVGDPISLRTILLQLAECPVQLEEIRGSINRQAIGDVSIYLDQIISHY